MLYPSPATTMSNLTRPHPLLRFALGAALALGSLSTACQKDTDALAQPARAAVAVTTDAVTNIDVPRTLRLTGTLRGERETDLAANVAGRITSMKLERGQKVEMGQLIAEVDVSAAALALKEARLAVETSKTQEGIDQAFCARYEQLKARGAVTDLEYDQVTAKCKTSPITTFRSASTCSPPRASSRSPRCPICGSSSACPSRTIRT